jgi:hypothetical protein
VCVCWIGLCEGSLRKNVMVNEIVGFGGLNYYF